MTRVPDAEPIEGGYETLAPVPVHGELKITRQLEFDTNLDSGSATDTSRGILVVQIRAPAVLAGVLRGPRGSGGH
jgi:hypothetical protein